MEGKSGGGDNISNVIKITEGGQLSSDLGRTFEIACLLYNGKKSWGQDCHFSTHTP